MARTVLGGLLVVLAMLVSSASASAFNVSGTYNANYHCEAGWCAGQDFPAPGVVLEQAKGSNVVVDPTGPTGTLNGHVLTLHGGSGGGYEFDETITFSADGKTWSGPLSDSNGTSGTDTGVKISGPAGEATVAGKVHDDLGSIAPGETVKLAGTSDEKEAISLSTTANPFGEYSFEVPPGDYAVTASGEMSEENGGTLVVAKKPGAPAAPGAISTTPDAGAPECDGTAKEATCTLNHVEEGKTVTANFTYTYCSATARLPNGKPPTRCPIIFIPGFLGSRLKCVSGEVWTNIPNPDFKDMDLETDGITNSPAEGACSASIETIPGQEGVVSTAAGADIYGAALAYLNKIMPQRAYAFTYDWRKSPLRADVQLDETVKEVLSGTGASRVVLMAHSMGGLVAQGYVANPSYAEKVARVVTLGTPYWGAPKSHVALFAGKSGEVATEAGLDQLIDFRSFNITADAENYLQIAARTMQGLYWLYPSANFGPWLRVYGEAFSSAPRGGTAVDPWVSVLGGVPALVDSAMAGHAQLDGFKTNGVDYEAVVGTGVPTIQSLEIEEDPTLQHAGVKVYFGSGDGTVPARSASQGQLEGTPIAGDGVRIIPVCGIGHVGLPGDPAVQQGIEKFLLKGEPVSGEEKCSYTGKQFEYTTAARARPKGKASSAGTTGKGPTATVVTASGATMTLAQASAQELVQVIDDGAQRIVVTNNHDPVMLKLSGRNLAVTVRTLTSGGKGFASGSGKPEYYGPVNGTLSLPESGPIALGAKHLKPMKRLRPPHTTARISRRGHRFLVRLSAKSKAGITAIYTSTGKGKRSRYSKPLLLTAKQLKKLRFASVDRFGTWEHLQKARAPRR